MSDESQNIPPIVEEATAHDVLQVEVEIKIKTENSPPAPSAPVSRPHSDQAIISESSSSILSRLLVKARQAIKQRKEKKKQKILSVLAEKGQLTNKDVQKITKLSRASVARYLDELEKEGRIEQVNNGPKTFYCLKSTI